MKKNINFFSMYPAFISIIIILFGIGLVGTASICLAQDSPWTTKANMQIPRHSLGTCTVNGKIYAIGGDTTGNACSAPGSRIVEEYDPSTNTWTIKAPMPTARTGLSISAVNGKIYALGGGPINCSTELTTVEKYDPLTDTWVTKEPMKVARHGLSTSVVNGKIYAIGGIKYSTDVASADVEEYDSITNTWTTKTEMPTARAWLSTCVVNAKIYAFGGHSTSPSRIVLDTIEEYDPVTDNWIPKADMPKIAQHTPGQHSK